MGVLLQIWRLSAGLSIWLTGKGPAVSLWSGKWAGEPSASPAFTYCVQHMFTHPPSALPEKLCRFHNPFHWGNDMQTLAKPDNY